MLSIAEYSLNLGQATVLKLSRSAGDRLHCYYLKAAQIKCMSRKESDKPHWIDGVSDRLPLRLEISTAPLSAQILVWCYLFRYLFSN